MADGKFAKMGRPGSNRGTGKWLLTTAFLKDQLEKKGLQQVMHSVSAACSSDIQLRLVRKRDAKEVEATMNGLNM